MKSATDECWTHCEAGSVAKARSIVEKAWGGSWRAVEINLGSTFIQFTNVSTEEQELKLKELRRNNLIKANVKKIITPKGQFDSISDAVKVYGTRAKIKTLMETYPDEYRFLEP